MSTRRFLTIAFALTDAGFALVLAACSGRTDPASICAAKETFDGLRAVPFAQLKEEPSFGWIKGLDDLALKMEVKLPRLVSVDPVTHKVVCQGTAELRVEKTAVLDAKQASRPVTYSRQPTADGKGFVYEMDEATTEDIGTLTARLARLHAEARWQASAPALTERKAPTATPVPGTGAALDPAAVETWVAEMRSTGAAKKAIAGMVSDRTISEHSWRGDYMEIHAQIQPQVLYGHQVLGVLVEEDGPNDVGCCRAPQVSLFLRSGGDAGALKSFASRNMCIADMATHQLDYLKDAYKEASIAAPDTSAGALLLRCDYQP